MAAEIPPAQWCADAVRRHDRERWLTALFAPEPARRRLMALYAFNLEVARARESVSQPTLGLMRLQWWRDALDGIAAGTPRAHPVVQALAEFPPDRPAVDRLLAARELDMQDRPIGDLTALEDYAAATSAGLQHLALDALEVDQPDCRTAAGHVGSAWAMVGLLRAVPFHAARGRLYLPLSLLAQCSAAPETVLAGRFDAGVGRAVEQVAATAAAHLDAARRMRVSRAAAPALLVATLAQRHLKRLRHAGFDPFRLVGGTGPGDLVRLAWQASRGRC